jgi:tRNA(Ile)-lysidine synthase
MIAESARRFLSERHIEPCRIVAAVSGGPDSVALLLALADLRSDGFETLCGHVNHHLRGADSDADETFVRDLCAQMKIECRIADGTLDRNAVKARGIEAAAREIRIERLQEIRRDTNAHFIATAHQKNDQAETVLMRLFRGSGFAGLRGIQPIRDDGLIRPLLECSRRDIETFLAERNVTARQDISNDDPRFLRNRIRQTLRQFDDAVIDNIAAIADQAREQWRLVESILDKTTVDVSPEETRFREWPQEPWLRQALLHRHISRLDPEEAREVSAEDLARIEQELDSIKRMSITKNLELVRKDHLTLRRKPAETAEFEFELKPGETRYIPEVSARVTLNVVTGFSPSHDRLKPVATFQLHCGNPVFTLRNRRKGDRFQPLGMSSDKKLKDFLIDRKIPVEVRDSLPLLVWNNHIVWVGGVEVSERFKVTDSAAELFEVRLERDGTSTAGEEGIRR